MNKLRFSPVLLAFIFTISIIPGLCLASHPNHVSSAEVNWNPKSGNFEVALCVWPADLEKALANVESKPIDLDKVENLDHLLKSYIERKFLIRPAQAVHSVPSKQDFADSAPTIRWVGHERDLKTAWLYFEIEGNKQASRWTIENRVFFELNEDQLNQLQLTVGKTISTVICRPGDSSFKLDTSGKNGSARSVESK